MKVTNSANQHGSYRYRSFESPCPRCGVRGAHYCPPVIGCMFDGLDESKVFGLVCNCPKCTVT